MLDGPAKDKKNKKALGVGATPRLVFKFSSGAGGSDTYATSEERARRIG